MSDTDWRIKKLQLLDSMCAELEESIRNGCGDVEKMRGEWRFLQSEAMALERELIYANVMFIENVGWREAVKE